MKRAARKENGFAKTKIGWLVRRGKAATRVRNTGGKTDSTPVERLVSVNLTAGTTEERTGGHAATAGCHCQATGLSANSFRQDCTLTQYSPRPPTTSDNTSAHQHAHPLARQAFQCNKHRRACRAEDRQADLTLSTR